ncbi:serine/threonine protein kinase [Gloeothece citriformis PCC 7424]|uniref:non-specific serine/threonine protein kinase n=1 Tax=Gloeothece citriformis (strain PCC 7424) TaxID=65393 RepID=B7KAA2_GLOC7|nr:serine/threonine-protein kinase [Gloeothece citriformis]ACK72876.1 serine/threonine protein kinase [Gloeothece citriformis PCC 7424]
MTTALLNNRYQILESLARGGFGETFLAIDTHMPSARKCVIKQLKPIVQGPTLPPWLQERFQREAAILENLGEKHPQIPQLYAYFAEDGDFYLVQEWIQGLTLTQKHLAQGNFSESEVRDILMKILPVLDFIHHLRIIHRDIKPDNIIIRESDGLPVLIDFGVMKEAMATLVHPDGVSAYSVALGTPGYMSSEQAAGRPVFSSDLYSLGLTAIFLLTGKTPQYLESDPRSGEILWRNAAAHLHSNLATVIDRSIRFHPRDRFYSAQEMLNALSTPTEVKTAATLAVSPGQLNSQRVLVNQPPSVKPETKVIPPPIEYEPEEKPSPLKGLASILAISGFMIGAFLVGFNIFLAQQGSRIAPSPSPTIETPEPSITPTPESQEPEIIPRRRPQPTPERPYTPPPAVEPSPTPVETIPPTPETNIPPEGIPIEVIPPPSDTETPPPETTEPPSETETPVVSPQTPTPEAQPPIATPQTPTPSPTSNTTPSPQPSPTPSPQPEKSTSGTQQSRGIKIPIIPTGMSNDSIRQKLGEPTTVNKGLWGNSRAVLYRNVVPNKVDVGYLFDAQTGRIRQTELSFAQTVGLGTMKTALNQLLSGKAPPSVKQALEQIYQRQSNQHSFLVGNLKGTIQRNHSDRIYIGIWESDFH